MPSMVHIYGTSFSMWETFLSVFWGDVNNQDKMNCLIIHGITFLNPPRFHIVATVKPVTMHCGANTLPTALQ